MSSWANIHKWVVRYSDESQHNADLDELRNIMEVEPINTTTDRGNTALHFAAIGTSTRILSYLVTKASPSLINTPNDLGETPLHWACSSGSTSHLRILLRAGADTGSVDCFQNSILHFAVQSGNSPVTKFLLRKKLCEVNTPNFEGKTALSIACEEHETQLIKLLVRYGASRTELLRYYVGINEPKIVKALLFKNKEINLNDKQQNPLHYAVSFNHYKGAKVLIQVNSLWKQETDNNGNTPGSLLRNTSDKRLAKLLAC